MTTKQNRQRALRQQQARLQRHIAALRRTSARLSWARLGAFFGGFLIVFFAFSIGGTVVWVSAALAVSIFGAAVFAHRRIERGMTRHRLLLALVEAHLARMDLDWAALPPAFDVPVHAGHPYHIDLDVTGDRSLHHLLDAATTREGSLRLSQWLLSPLTSKAAIEDRQALVRELIPMVVFRDKLAVSAGIARGQTGRRWSVARLLKWAESPEDGGSLKPMLLAAAGLAIIDAALFLLHRNGLLPPLWIAPFFVYMLLIGSRYRETSELFGESLELQDGLEQAGTVFQYLERFGYSASPRLRVLCDVFLSARPSTSLRRIRRIVTAAGLQQNVILWGIVNAVVPWDMFFAYQLRRERVALARLLPQWIDTWLELEALSSLAVYAYLNPAAIFPEISDAPMAFQARQLGHPLIPEAQRICNDFSIGAMGDVAIITGSNMSGKSSFLRTLGANLILTYAGAPAAAESLNVSVFRLFTCIRVTDSLADGISYFYAEARRLKALLDALESDETLPMFFLIDEIFRGTNNRERLIGSRAYIRALVGKFGVGVISTHDLELVQLADEMPQVTNYHFEDRIADGQMAFDYVLRDGPSPTTNALKIMRQVGLPVSEG